MKCGNVFTSAELLGKIPRLIPDHDQKFPQATTNKETAPLIEPPTILSGICFYIICMEGL